MLPLFRLKRALPVITAIGLSVAVWTIFITWTIIHIGTYDLMSIVVMLLLGLVFACSTTLEVVEAYHKWRKHA